MNPFGLTPCHIEIGFVIHSHQIQSSNNSLSSSRVQALTNLVIQNFPLLDSQDFHLFIVLLQKQAKWCCGQMLSIKLCHDGKQPKTPLGVRTCLSQGLHRSICGFLASTGPWTPFSFNAYQCVISTSKVMPSVVWKDMLKRGFMRRLKSVHSFSQQADITRMQPFLAPSM